MPAQKTKTPRRATRRPATGSPEWNDGSPLATSPKTPGWVSGRKAALSVFKTPKSPSPRRPNTRRSSVYPVNSKAFKLPEPSISSPPVSKRTRRSSVYHKPAVRLDIYLSSPKNGRKESSSPGRIRTRARSSMYQKSSSKLVLIDVHDITTDKTDSNKKPSPVTMVTKPAQKRRMTISHIDTTSKSKMARTVASRPPVSQKMGSKSKVSAQSRKSNTKSPPLPTRTRRKVSKVSPVNVPRLPVVVTRTPRNKSQTSSEDKLQTKAKKSVTVKAKEMLFPVTNKTPPMAVKSSVSKSPQNTAKSPVSKTPPNAVKSSVSKSPQNTAKSPVSKTLPNAVKSSVSKSPQNTAKSPVSKTPPKAVKTHGLKTPVVKTGSPSMNTPLSKTKKDTVNLKARSPIARTPATRSRKAVNKMRSPISKTPPMKKTTVKIPITEAATKTTILKSASPVHKTPVKETNTPVKMSKIPASKTVSPIQKTPDTKTSPVKKVTATKTKTPNKGGNLSLKITAIPVKKTPASKILTPSMTPSVRLRKLSTLTPINKKTPIGKTLSPSMTPSVRLTKLRTPVTSDTPVSEYKTPSTKTPFSKSAAAKRATPRESQPVRNVARTPALKLTPIKKSTPVLRSTSVASTKKRHVARDTNEESSPSKKPKVQHKISPIRMKKGYEIDIVSPLMLTPVEKLMRQQYTPLPERKLKVNNLRKSRSVKRRSITPARIAKNTDLTIKQKDIVITREPDIIDSSPKVDDRSLNLSNDSVNKTSSRSSKCIIL